MFDFTQLETDLLKAASDVKQLVADLEAVGLDIPALFAAQPEQAQAMLAPHAAAIGNTRLQNLICLGIPIYNMFAATQGWPVLPLPAFCSVPAP